MNIKMKTKVIPVIRGATETILKSLRKYMNNISGDHEKKELINSHIGHCTPEDEGKAIPVCESWKPIRF
jgi:hypothetical protein